MKNRIYITALLYGFLCIGLGSCIGFLDEDPETKLTGNIPYTSEEGLRAALSGAYVAYTVQQNHGCMFYELNNNSLILQAPSLKSSMQGYLGIISSGLSANETKYIEPVYRTTYSCIHRLNALIANAPNAPIAQEAKDFYLGQAKFFRAVAYFDLVRLWGRLPLITEAISSFEEAYMPRAGLKEVYRQIVDDFKVAWELMPEQGDTRCVQTGYPHRWAAKAYLTKVYLQMACLEPIYFQGDEAPYTDAEREQLMQQAYAVGKDVYKNSPYKLTDYYWELFGKKVGAGEEGNLYNNGYRKNTEESIFELQFNSQFGNEVTARTIGPTNKPTWAPVGGNMVNNGKIRAARGTFASHWRKYGNGKYLNSSLARNNISSNMEKGADIRLNTTYLYFDDKFTGDEATAQKIFPNNNFGGNGALPIIRKYAYNDFNAKGQMNLIQYRYADFLLTLAEIANELRGLGADDEGTDYAQLAVDCVEQVLARARNGNTTPDIHGVIQPASWSSEVTSDQEKMREAILLERQCELLAEGHDLFDSRRRGKWYLEKLIQRNDYWYDIVKSDPTGETDGWSGNTLATPYIINYAKTFGLSLGVEGADEDFYKKNMFLPFPERELRLNIGMNGEQNFGW